MDLSHTTSSYRIPRLLIAENNFSPVESLIRTFGDRRLDVDFDVCTSPRSAVRKLLASPYQLIISGAHLAEMDDFLLLKRTQALETFLPLVVTADASEKESAREVLQQGAFDVITTPLDHEQTVRVIRQALWHNKFKALIASREKALEKYRQHMADYPGDKKEDEAFMRALAAVQRTVSSVERTFEHVEKSIVHLSDFADIVTRMEDHTRKRALARLDGLGK